MPSALPTDITELQTLLLAERARCKQAEAEIQHLQALSHIPMHNTSPVLRIDAAGRLLFANPAAATLAREFRNTKPSQMRSHLMQAVLEVMCSNEVDHREVVVNGVHYLLFTVPVADDQSALLYLTNVTAQRQAEQTIRRQREFYETILAYLPAVVTVLDPDQRYHYINAYAEPDPAKRQARVGSTFANHARVVGLPPELAVQRRLQFEQAVSSRELVSWEEHWPDSNGVGSLYWLCYYQPVFGPDGMLRQMMCYGFDISTRRQAEARIRQSEADMQAQQAFMNLVLDLNPNLIWVRDSKARTVFENNQMKALRRHVSTMADTLTMEKGLDKEELKTFALADNKVLETGESLTTQLSLHLPNGETRWYQTVRCPLILTNGSMQILGVSTDITALKQAQHAAEAAAMARENFLANMSHEIRTPLNGILGMTSLLAKTGLNDQQRNYAAIIQHSGRHLLSVVNDVLDMAKITSGKLDLEQTAFNLCDSMSKAAEPLVIQAREKGIRVVGTLLRDSCPHPWVVGDSYRLNQIMLNLLSNAIKFTPAGGTVSVGGYFVSETEDTLTTEFRVTDTGIGIALDKQEAVFQKFTQAYADTTRQFGGTGLGLSISRALVEQMGGRLTVHSETGQGSSFSFITTLPKASAEARKAALTFPLLVQEAAVRGTRVLLVEDNAVNREVAQLLLEGHGVAVDEAANGLEALELFEQHCYDVVLMDIQMPGMNGLEATARIRAHYDPVKAATPILALTANAFRTDAEKYAAAGMNDTLSKPFDEAELLSKLASLMAGMNESLVNKPLVDVLPTTSAPTPAATAAASPNENPNSSQLPLVFDLTLLHKTAQGSRVFINRILASFHNNTPNSLDELRTALSVSDWPTVASQAHKLRPSLQLLMAAGVMPHLNIVESETSTATERQAGTKGFIAGLDELLAILPRKL